MTRQRRSTRFVDLEPLIREFTAASATIWSKATKNKHATDFARFLAWLDSTGRPCTTESLTYTTLLEYVDALLNKPAVHGVWRGDPTAVDLARRTPLARTLSRNTVHSYMSPLRTFCTYLCDEGVLEEDPFKRAGRSRRGVHPLLPSEDTPTKGSTPDDFEMLLRGISGNEPDDLRDRAMAWLFWTCGGRTGALSRLRLEDVDFDKNIVTLRRGKGNKTLEVPLIPQSKIELMRYLHRGRPRLLRRYPVRGYETEAGMDPGWVFLARASGPSEPSGLTPNGILQMLTRRYHGGGGQLSSFGGHRLRHGMATNLANNGVDLGVIQELLGHADIKTTKRYAKQTPQSIGIAVARVINETTRASRKHSRRAA